MGNPFCPKCKEIMRVKKVSGTRYWICDRGHRYKAGATELKHFKHAKETTEEISEALQNLISRIYRRR